MIENKDHKGKDDCCKPRPKVCVGNVAEEAIKNRMFRKEYWTGCNLQMTLMCIPCGGDIGKEVHCHTDQIIRVEKGCAVVEFGMCKEKMCTRKCLHAGDAVFIPEGTWHNVKNNGTCPLKLSSIYAPSHHSKGTMQATKEEA